MNGPIAQIVGLTCHANAFLARQEVEEFFPSNSTCTFCDRVTFIALEKSFLGKPKEKGIAGNPNEWFAYVKSSGAKGVRLGRTPQNDPLISDRMSAGFVGGGGTWSMEVVLPKERSEYWIARWEVWNQDAPERRIWRVTYARVSSGATAETRMTDLHNVGSQLAQALRDIHGFSERHDCGGFTQCFAHALDTLDSEGKNLQGYHKDLAPSGYLSRRAQTILDACQKSWVFGGMGSWNDMGFDGKDQEEYEKISDRLFQNVNEAISAAANTTYYGLEQGAEGDAVGRAP